MKRLAPGVVVLVAAPVWAVYTYYFTDSLVSLNTSNWTQAGFSQNAWGRLAAVTFENENYASHEQLAYLYSYNQAGRVATQRLRL